MTDQPRPLRLGTRRSALAVAQSQQVADQVTALTGRAVELVELTSEGDTNRASLSEIGGQGIFATALREALRSGEVDFLVHSLKDLPTVVPEGLVIAATPTRVDARDVVITRDGTPLQQLKPGATVGTGSPRRIAQTRIHAPRVKTVDIRGNVDSRIQRVRSGELDAVILAAAGLGRIVGDPTEGLHVEYLGLSEWPTAPGQGALAVEALAVSETAELLAGLDDEATRLAVTAERAVLQGLDAGCQAPVGAHAKFDQQALRLRVIVYSATGDRIAADVSELIDQKTSSSQAGYGYANDEGNGADFVAASDPMTEAREIGHVVARRLLDRGAGGLVLR